MEKVTNSSGETIKLGFDLAQHILENKVRFKEALVVSLEGGLGAGKTTFMKGFAKGLGIEASIRSPTFLIIKRYRLRSAKSEVGSKKCEKDAKTDKSRFSKFYHIDCYRIERAQELLDLGVEDIFKDPKAVVAVEWGQKVKSILPERAIVIKFKHISKGERKIIVENDKFPITNVK